MKNNLSNGIKRRGLAAISSLLPIAILLFLIPAFTIPTLSDPTGPVIDVWYGDRQIFGAPGEPQKWINILGNAGDAESGLRALGYSLNGGEEISLMAGPDRRRLARPGDFNIEIERANLKEGENHLEIIAVNQQGLQSSREVIVQFSPHRWPLPYAIDWASVKNAQDVVQIVDGKWSWDENGIRPVELGYDRVLAIGDMSWESYEVLVEVTLHGIDTSGYKTKESGGAGFGINLHWLGHTDQPRKCSWPSQPHCGWEPTGASNWYSFKRDGIDTFGISSEPPADGSTKLTSIKLQFGRTYIFRARVEVTGDENIYSLKLWEKNGGSEPEEWTVVRASSRGGEDGNLSQGSFLLVLHHVDATFGRLRVEPLSED